MSTHTIDRPKTAASVTAFSAGLPASEQTFEVDYRMPVGSYAYPVTIKNNGAVDLSSFDAIIIGQDIYGQKLEEKIDLTTATNTATTTGLFSSMSRIQTDITGVVDTAGYQPTVDILANVAGIELIEDGALNIAVDGATAVEIIELDFDTVSSVAEVAAILVTGLAALDVTVTEASDVITITSNSTGSSSSIAVTAGTGTGTNVVDTGLIVMDTAVDGVNDEILQVGYAVSSSEQKGIALNSGNRNLQLAVTPGTSAVYTVQFSNSSIDEAPVWFNIDDSDLVGASTSLSSILLVTPVMLRVSLGTAGSTDTKLVINQTRS